jgi:hypothetical protein
MRLLVQILTLILVFVSVFVVNSFFADFLWEILGILALFSVIFLIAARKRGFGALFKDSPLSVFVILTGILLVISATGGLSSNIFFLSYFLVFGLSVMFEPLLVFVFAAFLIFLFLPQALEGDTVLHTLQLASLVILSPFAFFFGSEYKKEEKIREEVAKKTEEIKQTAGKLLETERQKLDEKGVQEINQILEEAEELEEDVGKS